MVKADLGWALRAIKVEGGDRLFYIPSQRFPIVGLGKDVLSQALRHIASVRFLGDFEDNLVHAVQITALRLQ